MGILIIYTMKIVLVIKWGKFRLEILLISTPFVIIRGKMELDNYKSYYNSSIY